MGLSKAWAAAVVVGLVLVGGLRWATTGPRDVVLVSATADSSATPPGTAPSTPPSSSPQATEVCQARLAQYAGRDNELHVSLVAAYASTAAEVAVDEEGRRGGAYRSPWRDRPPGEFEAVCFFDADAFGLARPPTPGSPPPPAAYDRLEEIVRPDGTPVVYEAGRKATVTPEPIPSGAGQ